MTTEGIQIVASTLIRVNILIQCKSLGALSQRGIVPLVAFLLQLHLTAECAALKLGYGYVEQRQ